MPSPLSGSLSRQIYQGMKGLFLDATLTRDVLTDSPAYDPTVASSVDYPCKAVRDEYSVGYRTGGLVRSGDVKIIVLQLSLSITPLPGDRITISGMGGPWIVVPGDSAGLSAVSADPANATWNLRARA